jgi:hypothetical protein
MPRRGATSLVATWPSGLSLGPVSTRATNPKRDRHREPEPSVADSETQHQSDRTQQQDTTGDGASRLLVDRVREPDDLPSSTS